MNKRMNILMESWKIHLRCIRDIKKYNSPLLISGILSILLNSVFPYATIYFSARIINELAGLRRILILRQWVLLSIGVEAVLFLFKEVAKRWNKACFDIFLGQRKKMYAEKMITMDFSLVERSETKDLLDQIKQNDFNFELGLGKTISIFDSMLSSFVSIICAGLLTASLFAVTVPNNAGAFTYLNHPLIPLFLIVMMLLTTIICSSCANRSNEIFAGLVEENRLGNRLCAFFGWISCDQNKAFDFRLYDQPNVIEYYYKKSLDIFGTNGAFAKNQKGKMGIFAALSGGLSAIFTGLIYIYACLKARAGAFGIGSITQYIGAITTMSQSFVDLMESIGEMINNTPFLQTVYTYFDMPDSTYLSDETAQFHFPTDAEIAFEDVSFRYPNSETWALQNISMRIPAGCHIAIVGENGSGKSTFIKLLCRLYEPQKGRILLNGVDIRDYRYQEYMDHLSVVFQDFQLLSQPLGCNVAGCANYDQEKVLTCLRQVGLFERSSTLPQGLDTQIYKDFGEDGMDISGGEAQKIAIARALYKDSKIIVLDEPTAALDPIAEADIYSNFNNIVGNKTAVFISHRLSSCKICDEIAVFHKGRLVQLGSHDQLVAERNGKYYELWNAQAQYYTESVNASNEANLN